MTFTKGFLFSRKYNENNNKNAPIDTECDNTKTDMSHPNPDAFVFQSIHCPLDVINEDETDTSEYSDEQALNTSISTEGSSSGTVAVPYAKNRIENKNLTDNHINGKKTLKYSIPPYLRVREPHLEIAHKGEIMAKFIQSGSFFRKKWEEVVWVHYLPSLLLFFSCEENFHCYMTNPMLSVETRMGLIRFALDFDTKRVVKRMKNAHQTNDCKHMYMNFEVGKVKSAKNGSKGTMLHTFKIERFTHSGSAIPAKFGSTNIVHLQNYRNLIKKCTKRQKKSSNVIKLTRKK
mmetsp:Transcript_48187/g.58338  ORF Transcript_48187/g.58338 Transcript_48187/m.58338 type:complete len:290 (-) Transcript_48187:301-1170(-)